MMTHSADYVPVSIEEEMKTAYLDFAMSVIIGRALPDVRDGLKPVHRRVLYAMYREGLLPGRKFAKCARVVGEVIGKYHPHGDAAVYDTLVRMAQDFNLRYPLVDGQGNFGSIDGDPPAAYRYTEARLTHVAMELLEDLDRETVDFIPNFDETLSEPVVLPARLPNLLINGAEGIAVGMSTHIPPHNLSEVCDALIHFIDHPEADVDELMQFIKGPDFPTGGICFSESQIKKAYSTGRGIIRIRARMEVEKLTKAKREAIVIKEIPYQTNKSDLIEEIARLVQNKKIEGIHDIRDESNRQGIRVVIELKRGENPDVIMNQLYQHTRLEISYGIHLLAIDNLQPRLMTLPEILRAYIRHRKEVIYRRTGHELRKARHRAHIVEGLVKALDLIDAVIETIRSSSNVPEARTRLMERFEFTEIQAQAILDMQLQRLTGLERQKLLDELTELRKRIEYLEFVLSSNEEVLRLIKQDLSELKEKYGDGRRTQILGRIPTLHEEDLIREEMVVITATEASYIKRTPFRTFSLQRRGGKGRIGMALREEDNLAHIVVASTLDHLLFFFDNGRVYQLRVHEIPEMSTNALGRALINILPVRSDEHLVGILRVPFHERDRYRYVVMATQLGVIKRMSIDDFTGITRGGRRVIRLRKGDRFLSAALTTGHSYIFLGTARGRGLTFSEQEITPQGRTGSGVRGIRLKTGDRVIAMHALTEEEPAILIITEKGIGKRVMTNHLPRYHRGSTGVIIIRVRKKSGQVVDIKGVHAGEKVMITTRGGMAIVVNTDDIPAQGRHAGGVRVINVKDDDTVRRIAPVPTE